MLINNKQIIQEKNSFLSNLVVTDQQIFCEITQAKSGVDTLILQDEGQTISYHSRYNPVQEAKATLQNHLNDNTKYVLLIGVGLGYLIHELNNDYPHVRYSIYEPNETVMKILLENFDFSKVRMKNLDEIFTNPAQLKDLRKFYFKLADENSIIIINPIMNKLYGEDVNLFIKNFKEYLVSYKSNTITDLNFQTRWTINSIVNFSEVLTTPNLFKDIDLKKLVGNPVLIVAAGPSLDEEIENIRVIKDRKKAFIFAVGSAVNTLIKHGISPDVLFSYDPTAENAEVVKRVKELGLKIPLIFGTSVGFEALKDYPGAKVHFFTSQDSININLINEANQIVVPDAPTIATITLYILGKIKMGPIILVGQNLSITKEKTYAEGIHYVGDVNVTAETLKAYNPTLSTTNEEIYTDESYLRMRDSIEYCISNFTLEGKVFNTTRNGLPITGAPYVPLSEIMDKILIADNLVEADIFNVNNSYNVKEALGNFVEFEKSFDSLIIDFKKLVDIDIKIREAYVKKLINNVQNYFSEFDKYFSRIENNPFFLQVIAPTTRNQYKRLVAKSEEVRFEKRPLKKMEKYIEIYSKYIPTIYVAIVEIQPAFAELKKSGLFKKEDSK